ncbi:MAG: ABC-F family ATP-binding cassette domain-containing protein [Asticcacaulis sp.]
MSAITLTGLSWATPDGHTLFSHLDLTFSGERTGLVGRNGVGKSTLLDLMSGALTPQSGSLTVNGTIAALPQFVHVAPEETVADIFGVSEALRRLQRIETGNATEDDFAEADWTLEPRIETALSALRLEARPETQLLSLSGGQRTRVGLSALMFHAPDFILLDEPTNHLDREGRRTVIDLLAGWKKGAVIVSHDRELLEGMDAIVELTTLGATRYQGGWSAYRERRAEMLMAARRELSDAEKRLSEVSRETQSAVERQARRDSGGRKKAVKGDMPRILMGMRKDRAEDNSGSGARLAERRRTQAEGELSEARQKLEVLEPLTVDVPSTGLAAGKTVLRLEAVTAGYGAGPVIRDLSLTVTGPERIAVTGPNGSGKSTLFAVIGGVLLPLAGEVEVLNDFAMLDQQVGLLDPAISIRANFLRLNPGSDENACRAALARFRFRADAALQIVGTLSGGEKLRAGLACVLGRQAPPLLLLDEPTNHLDIDAIEAVEAGLRAYDGALLIVSHDTAFLEAIGVTRTLILT